MLLAHHREVALGLNPTAAGVAERLATPLTLTMLRDVVAEGFGVSADRASETIAGLLPTLTDRRLVEEVALPEGEPDGEHRLRRRYLDLLMATLVDLIYAENELRIEVLRRRGPEEKIDTRVLRDIRWQANERYEHIVSAKLDGSDPTVSLYAHTLVGQRRLQNLERCAARVFSEGISGDFVEAGVWKGGAAIFLRALQVAYAQPQRSTWLADSFAGLPAPSHPVDKRYGLDLTEAQSPWIAIDQRTVQDNFRAYDLLSENVRFLTGWFEDTLPSAPIKQIAILRIDADYYASTHQALSGLYDRVSPGGWVIVDDYFAFEPCRRAVDEFLGGHPRVEIRRIDCHAICWRKP